MMIDMSSNYQVSNSCTPSTTYFGNSYNNRNSEHDTSSQVFVDDRVTVEDNTAPILVRVLVVDDEPDINLIKIMLERQKGFRVNSFDDPDLALQSFKPGIYDLLLLDIKTPSMNGIDLYIKVRKIDENIKVCFMSANKCYYEEFRHNLLHQLKQIQVSFKNHFGMKNYLEL